MLQEAAESMAIPSTTVQLQAGTRITKDQTKDLCSNIILNITYITIILPPRGHQLLPNLIQSS